MDSYIRKEDMKDFCIYFCEARNFSYGIWYAGKMHGIRSKWGDKFIDTEFHWDDGPENCGTCKPYLQITTQLTDRLHPSFFDVSNWRGQGVLLDILSPFNRLVTGVVVAKASGAEGGGMTFIPAGGAFGQGALTERADAYPDRRKKPENKEDYGT